ncbi:alpha-1A adrenergic receptor-like [Astyanax mexicanus]|uniref:Alpha-1A adrenergic receptor n=1 Tax=Astyanax mexicanus TaxID=7994 RepID=A0A8B9K5P1_ASTMX|nr:alpha-1A adrenergic receptor-like [Astyanax mexicanus]
MVPAEDNITGVPILDGCLNCSLPSLYPINLPKAVAMGLVFTLFVIFGVMGNILVILSVACHRHLRSVTHYFIANLAMADLLLSSTVLPFSASSELLGRWVFGRTLCCAWTALDVLCCTASILSLSVISIDRCVAVSYPLRYPSLATSGRGLGAVAAVWGLSAAISVGPLFGWREPMPEDESVCRVNEDPGYAIFSAACSFYVPLTVILVMYCRVYVVARRKSRSLREGRQLDGGSLRIHCGNTQRCSAHRDGHGTVVGKCRSHSSLLRLLKFSREKKAAKTLGVVVGCFILCWLPFFLVLPISSIFPSHRPPETVFKITFWLGYFNSCLNPIIYPCFSQEFKKAFQNLLRGHCFHRAARPWSPRPRGSLTPPSSQTAPNSSSVTPSAPNEGSGGGGGPPVALVTGSHGKSLLKVCCFNANYRVNSTVTATCLQLSHSTASGSASGSASVSPKTHQVVSMKGGKAV